MKKGLLASFLFMAHHSPHAQDKSDIEKLKPKRFIDKVAIIVGPSLVSVWDNDQYNKYGVTKFGYAVGIELTHSTQKRIELSSLILWERKGQKQIYPVNSVTGQIIEKQCLRFTFWNKI